MIVLLVILCTLSRTHLRPTQDVHSNVRPGIVRPPVLDETRRAEADRLWLSLPNRKNGQKTYGILPSNICFKKITALNVGPGCLPTDVSKTNEMPRGMTLGHALQ